MTDNDEEQILLQKKVKEMDQQAGEMQQILQDKVKI